MYKKAEAIVNRCQHLLDCYGASVVDAPNISDRRLQVSGVGAIEQVGKMIWVEAHSQRIRIDFAVNGFENGQYPPLDVLKKIEPMLDRMEEQIKAIRQYLEPQQSDDWTDADKTETTEKDFPKGWLLALDFAVYACQKLGIDPKDTPREAIEVMRVLLLLG